MTDQVVVRGAVSRVFFCNPESPAMAGALRTEEGEQVRFAGKLAAALGDKVELTGRWITHKKFGEQLEVESFRVQMDESPEALASLLANDDRFTGVGPSRARKIVAAAASLAQGGSISDALMNQTERIAQMSGAPLKVVMNAAEVWALKRSHFEALTRLTEQGWSGAQAQAIVHVLGEHASAVIEQNPYSLIGRVPRFGFRTVDAVALKMGVTTSDPFRLIAGVAYCLQRIADDGHVWTTRENLIGAAEQELRPDTMDGRDQIALALQKLVEEKLVIVTSITEGSEVVADATVARSEFAVFERLIPGLLSSTRDAADRLLGKPLNDVSRIRLDGEVAQRVIPTLNSGQAAALQGIASSQYAVIAGGAGVGKTYMMRAVCDIAESCGLKVALCAPTGKAAKKLARATGRQAQTVHRLLEPQYDAGSRSFRFTRFEKNPIPANMIVIDEMTMVDVRLMKSLLDAVHPRAKLLMVGDHNQIPSVGPGAILRDLLASRDRFPGSVHVLEEVVRQAGVLDRNTRSVLDGLVVQRQDKCWRIDVQDRADPQGGEIACAMLAETLTNELKVEFAWDVQVLAPKREGPLGTYSLNVHLQKLRQRMLKRPEPEPTEPNKPPKPLLGDRVIWTQNDYDLELFNGTQGIIMEIKGNGDLMLLTEDGVDVEVPSNKRKFIEVAYAMTIHKAQGSEWPVVILAISSSHHYMRDRNLLYTGVSRASEVFALVGDARGVSAFASSLRSTNRQTFGRFIANGWSAPEVA